MRDILISTFIFGLVPFILRSPLLGAYVWAWLSMMNPHRLTFGFAQSLPFAQVVAVATLLPFLFSRQRKPLPLNSITVVLLLLLFWMGVTSVFALNSAEVVLDRVIFVAKIQLMLFVTLMLVRGRRDIDWLIWVVTLSIGYFGIKGGVFTLITGGGYRVYGPQGTLIGENNALAIALVMVLPFMYYLYQTTGRQWVRYLLIACMVSVGMSILGSQSRGALLALLVMAAMLGLKSRHPVRVSLFLVLLVVAALAFMPDTWTNRMETIQTYQDDNSAMSRLYTWQTLWNLAVDRPLVGAGFRTDSAAIFARYAPYDGTTVFGNGGVFVAHSIYFQALGEHGFPGLILFVLLGVTAWRRASRLVRLTRNDPEFGTWVPQLMPMIQVSLLGFAVGGAFLSLMNFDFPYYIIGYVVLVDATVRDRLNARSAVPGSSVVGSGNPAISDNKVVAL